MNFHPTALFLPLTEPALFHPLAGWKEEGQSPSPVGFGAYLERKGPFEELKPGCHPIMTNTPTAFFLIVRIAFSRHGLC